MSAKDLINSLRLCPALRLLHVNTPTRIWPMLHKYDPFGTTHILSKELLTLFAPLLVLDTDKVLCPKLEHIEFLAPEAEFSEADVVKFIKRKQESKGNHCFCRLDTIKVAISRQSLGDEEIMADLKQYTDAGLLVEFKYLPAPLSPPIIIVAD